MCFPHSDPGPIGPQMPAATTQGGLVPPAPMPLWMRLQQQGGSEMAGAERANAGAAGGPDIGGGSGGGVEGY